MAEVSASVCNFHYECPTAANTPFNHTSIDHCHLPTFIELVTTSLYSATNKLSDASFNALAADVMTQCDADDGVKDGVIIDPLNCKPDFSKFLCGNLPDSSAFNATTCLNQAQVDKVVSIYANWTKPDGTSIYPQYEPGSEYSWAVSVLESSQWTQEHS